MTAQSSPVLPVDPVETARPADVEAVRDAFATARARDLAVLVRGAGTKLSWGAPPTSERDWLALDTRGLDRIVHHEAGDMTAIVEAGVPLATLQEALAAHGQWWAVDPPHVEEGATVGGIVAANDGGPRRHRYGAVRDLVIGVAAVLPDGTVARSGGTVIKNVAGYDLAKLHCGALGTLGAVVRLALRLHPRPAASRTLRVAADAATATALVVDLLASPVDPSAVDWSDQDGGALHVRVEGRADAVDDSLAAVAAVARRHAAAIETVDPDRERWDTIRAAHAGEDGTTVARAAARPAELAEVASALVAAAASAPNMTATLHSHAGLGLHDAVLRGGDAADHGRVVAGWRAALTARSGSVVVRRRIAGLDDHVDAWTDPAAPLPPSVAVGRAVKAALDPEGRCAPGRFLGGI